MVRNKTIFLVLLATALLYANSLRNCFVWDDNTFIVNNPYLKSYHSVPLFFSEDAWRLSASPMDSPYYRPLLFLSFFVDHLFWGLNPFGYHLTNLLIHLANVMLVFYLVRLVCGSEDLALFSSLFFAVHPIQT